VRTIEPNEAMKSSHSCECRSKRLPVATPSELDQRDRDAELDGDDARHEDDGRENCCELDGLHA